VLLNLDKLQDVEFHWRAHAMEDIQFNRDANTHGAVLCKCYRFAFYSPQINKGGCSYMKACNDGAREVGGATKKPAPAPVPAEPLPPAAPTPAPSQADPGGKKPELLLEKPVIQLNECSSVEDVGRWLRGIDKLRGDAEEYARKFKDHLIDGHVLLNLFTRKVFGEFCDREHVKIKVGDQEKILEAIESLKTGAAGSFPAAAAGTSTRDEPGGGSHASGAGGGKA
jgi:hypothetical protein